MLLDSIPPEEVEDETVSIVAKDVNKIDESRDWDSGKSRMPQDEEVGKQE